MSTKEQPPRIRQSLARLQHECWADASRCGIHCRMPLQLYNHLERIKLPRQLLKHRRLTPADRSRL